MGNDKPKEPVETPPTLVEAQPGSDRPASEADKEVFERTVSVHGMIQAAERDLEEASDPLAIPVDRANPKDTGGNPESDAFIAALERKAVTAIIGEAEKPGVN